MKPGEIFYWVTDKAIGFESRPKYHIFICPEDWRDGHTFLFINKSKYGEDFEISNKEYMFLPLPVSYIDCGSVVAYSDAELAQFKITSVGQLSTKHLQELFHRIAGSDRMVGWQIKRVCSVLQKCF
jgi:hypothetical protein